MSNLFSQIAFIQFPIICLFLLILLARTRVWAYYHLFRKILGVFFLYLIYCVSAISFLTIILLRYGDKFSQNLALGPALIFFIFVAVPLFSNLILMLFDKKFEKKKKMKQLQQFFTTTDSIILFLLAHPVVFVEFTLLGSRERLSDISLFGALFFVIALSALALYKMVSLPKLINEKRLWWVILAEWIFLAAAYSAILSRR